MVSYRLELDAPNNIVMVMVTEDDGKEHDFQFDFDPRTGRWEFSEKFILERDYGEELVADMEQEIEQVIGETVAKNTGR